jgi:hypothetical protein
MTSNEIKDFIIKDAKDCKDIYLSTSKIYDKIIDNQEKLLCKECLRELESEGLIKFETQRIHISLTKLGKYAASIGYTIYENELEENKKQTEIDTKLKTKLELKALQFNNTWKYTIVISLIASIGGFVLALLAYIKQS